MHELDHPMSLTAITGDMMYLHQAMAQPYMLAKPNYGKSKIIRRNVPKIKRRGKYLLDWGNPIGNSNYELAQ